MLLPPEVSVTAPNPQLAERHAGYVQRPYRTAIVPAGASVVVWDERIPRHLVGFAVAVGNNLRGASDEWDVRVDGQQVEGGPIQHEIAKPERPLRFVVEDRPWAGPIKNRVIASYTNNGSVAVMAEFYLEVALYVDVN